MDKTDNVTLIHTTPGTKKYSTNISFVNVCVAIMLAFFKICFFFHRTTQVKLNFFPTLFILYLYIIA